MDFYTLDKIPEESEKQSKLESSMHNPKFCNNLKRASEIDCRRTIQDQSANDGHVKSEEFISILIKDSILIKSWIFKSGC